MTESSSITILLVATVVVVAYVALVVHTPAEEPEEGRVLALLRIEGAEPGFSNTTTFQVQEAYERIGLTYNISEAAHVRASVTAPDGTQHEADPVVVEAGPDRLELNVHDPAQGTWGFTVWTLDDPDRPGYITHAELYILGFGGPRSSPSG